MTYDVINSMQFKVIGAYLNANEMLSKADAREIHSIKLDEHIFTNVTFKAIARAINKVKESGAEVCELNVSYFLETHGMPRNQAEADVIIRVQSEYAVTPKSFRDYIKQIKAHRGKKVAI